MRLKWISGLEAGVELNDELLVDVSTNLVAVGQTGDDSLELLGIEGEPARDGAGAVLFQIALGKLAGGREVLDLDLVAGLAGVAGDIDLVAVHANVTVADELAGGRAALGETKEVDHAVETGFEELEEAFAGDAALVLGDLEGAAELTLKQTVGVTELLLFIQTDGILGELAAELGAVLAGGEVAFLKRLGGAENRLTETATDAGGRTCVTSLGGLLLNYESGLWIRVD